jgi:hypothetical protein
LDTQVRTPGKTRIPSDWELHRRGIADDRERAGEGQVSNPDAVGAVEDEPERAVAAGDPTGSVDVPGDSGTEVLDQEPLRSQSDHRWEESQKDEGEGAE